MSAHWRINHDHAAAIDELTESRVITDGSRVGREESEHFQLPIGCDTWGIGQAHRAKRWTCATCGESVLAGYWREAKAARKADRAKRVWAGSNEDDAKEVCCSRYL